MKCKKILSFLLAVVMILGVLPMTALAAGTQIGTSTNGEFVDTTADPNKSYEYTVTGSDGSTKTVVVPAAGAEPTGNSVTSNEVPGAVYYQKVTDPANANGEGYLLVDPTVNKKTGMSQAVSTRPGVENVTIEGDRINGEHANAEWNVTKPENGKLNFGIGNQSLTVEQIRKGEGKRKDPYTYSYKVVLGPKDSNNQQIHVTGDTIKLSRTYYEPTRSWQTATDYPVDVYLNIEGTNVMGDKNADHATSFTLFEKKTEPGTSTWIVDTTGLDALLAKSFVESQYTTDSWKTYADAKAAAEKAKTDWATGKVYDYQPDADAALIKIDNATRVLDAAIKGLTKKPVEPVKPGTCVKPEITWHRTWEPSDNKAETIVGYPDPIQHIENKNPWHNIIWKWDQIKNLTASNPDPWNIKDANEIKDADGKVIKEGTGSAATWTTPSLVNNGNDWLYSNVRRFTGTFTWPEGVGLDGTMTLQSINDADYQFIYDYINEKDQDGNYQRPELQKRYGDAKVIPINDDMYVFISKVSDGEPSSWTAEQAKSHLAFWTGTTGKGIWSMNGNTGGDWSRTTPAAFLGNSATPAYRGAWPNLIDRGGSNTDVSMIENPDNPALHLKPDGTGKNSYKNPNRVMAHTDRWYTMTDTNALKSQLNELYGATADLGGQEMRIDIYAFNNSGTGGMDELELILCAAEPTTAQVQVNYWLDSVGATSLGTTVMTKNIGETVNLPNGTNTNELNHKKAEAIRIAGESADVSNGNQIEKDFVVQKSGNVINVVYTRTIQGVKYYTYDFGVQNQYIYKDENTSAITGVSVECATDTIGASFRGHDITLTYTPKDALGSFVQATLVVNRKNNTNRYSIGFIPASNVLYEENFITGTGDWVKTDHEDMTVIDNNDNVYGHTAVYDSSIGANGEYTATVTETTKKTGDLKFSFRGLGLDLIGSCGPNYGTLAVKVMQGNSVVKTFIVNTSYAPGVIHQVPLLHTQKGLLAGSQYDVTVRGIYVAPAAANTLSTMSVDGSSITPDLYEQLLDLGLTDADMNNVEFVNAADNLPAVSGNVSVMSAAPVATTEQTVSVDSFRVYRSTEKAEVAYAKNEQNLIYTNVMDEAITGKFSAYVEKDAATGEFTTKTYEKAGGPENELYLPAGAGVVFQLAEGASYAQVSLRAVDGATKANTNITLNHNTEMYYEVTPDSNGMITITNTGNQLLAIGNLKTNGKITTISDKGAAVQAVAAFFAMPEEDVFTPAVLRGSIRVSGIGRTRLNTLTVTASSDVAALTVDGKTIRPMNKVLVDLGLADEYVYKVFKRTNRSDAASFEVVAYDANGLASEPVIIHN